MVFWGPNIRWLWIKTDETQWIPARKIVVNTRWPMGKMSHARRFYPIGWWWNWFCFGDQSIQIHRDFHGFLEVQNKMHRKKVLGKDQLLFIWKNPKIYIDLPTSNIHCTWWEHLIRLRKALGRPIMRPWPQRGQRRYSSKAGFGRVNGGRWWKMLDVFVPWFTIEMEVSMGKSSINDGFSSKPCLMTPEGNMVYSWRWLSFGSCQTQFMFMFIPTWVMISPCHFTMPFHFGKSEPQILSFKLWHGATTRALDDFFQAQMSTLERIECYLGAFESGSPHFFGSKKRGFDAALPQWGY